MFECTICGLLSLGGSACPACGSLLLVDLSLEDDDSGPLPTEVPGLDDAVASWYDLEGIEPPTEPVVEPVSSSGTSSLPFGYSGESNTHISRLPFGVGSYAGGMPFDESEDALPLISERSSPEIETTSSAPIVQPPTPVPLTTPAPVPVSKPAPEPAPMPVPIAAPSPALPPAFIPEEVDVPVSVPSIAIIEATPMMVNLPPIDNQTQSVPRIEPEPLRVAALVEPQTAVHEAPSAPTFAEEVPDMWRIDASPVDMDQIYAMEDQTVDVVHTEQEIEEPYLHTEDVEQEEMTEMYTGSTGVISLDLHPAKALGVNLDGHPELEDILAEGFYAIGQESWAQAAISFQKMAAKMPGDAAVFNNYGLALLQRALVMAKSRDLEIQQLASTQFESSILALREAAKSSPTNPTLLLNLSHALLVSGRAEKALNLLNMYEKNHSKTSESANLEAASLVSLGESGRALKVLQLIPQDEIIRSNVAKLTYS
ncbi:MAG: hypothetical protein OSA21_07250 [Candidatus Poseidoniaceae archaeon]|nr:hypothetical protein [Candidatus Poseidoniaceae archaeon]